MPHIEINGEQLYYAESRSPDANITSGANIVYVVTATNSGGTGEGYIYAIFDRIPTAGN